MTSYHGWTHRRKSDGGTDPIYPDGDEPWTGGGGESVPTPWAWRSEGALTTNVPTSGAWTNISMNGGEVAAGQTALTHIDHGIHVEEEGIYLITLVVWFPSGGSGGWCQTRLVWEHEGVSAGASVLSSAVSHPADAVDNIRICQMTRFVAYPGVLSGFSDIKVACRQTTSAVQTPIVMLSVVQLTPLHNGSPDFPRL